MTTAAANLSPGVTPLEEIARMNTATSVPDIPLPRAAEHAALWEADTPMPSRTIYGIQRTVTDSGTWLESCGSQWADGSIDDEPSIDLHHDDRTLNSDQARELAAALLQAAGDLDGWTR
jgi:hypothetical protein